MYKIHSITLYGKFIVPGTRQGSRNAIEFPPLRDSQLLRKNTSDIVEKKPRSPNPGNMLSTNYQGFCSANGVHIQGKN